MTYHGTRHPSLLMLTWRRAAPPGPAARPGTPTASTGPCSPDNHHQHHRKAIQSQRVDVAWAAVLTTSNPYLLVRWQCPCQLGVHHGHLRSTTIMNERNG